MDNELVKNNQVYFSGELVSDLLFSHQSYDEEIYSSEIKITRFSGVEDIIPFSIPKSLILPSMKQGSSLCALGQFRSRKVPVNGHSKLLVSIYVKKILNEPVSNNSNQIIILGQICNPPVYRTTPFGCRITDLIIKVQRPYGKMDYLPAIAWSKNALFAADLQVNDKIIAFGRIQSRKYSKLSPENNEVVTFTTYEISISQLAVVDSSIEASDELYNNDLFHFPQICD